MNFINACKLLVKRKKITRKNKNFRAVIDYIQIGIDYMLDEYRPKTLIIIKNNIWQRYIFLLIDDYLATDWEEYQEKKQ